MSKLYAPLDGNELTKNFRSKCCQWGLNVFAPLIYRV